MKLARWVSRGAATLSFWAGVCCATPVYAQASRERARDLFVHAGQAASRGAWAEAVDLYLESYVTFPHPSTLHNIGRCYYENGDDYQALSFTARALFETPQDGVSRLSEANRQAAQQQLSELLARLGRVELAADAAIPNPAWIRVDGVLVVAVPLTTGAGLVPMHRNPPEPVSWRAPDALWLLPGLHDVQVSDGVHSQTVRVHVQSGATSPLTFAPWSSPKEPTTMATGGPVHSAAVTPPSAVRPSQSPEVTAVVTFPARHDSNVDDRRSTQRESLPWRGFAVGSWAVSAVGFGLGVGATLVANDLDSQLQHACPNGDCPPESMPQVEHYDRTVLVSYVGFGVGLLTALTGGVFWIFGDETLDSSQPVGTSTLGSPSVSLGSDGQRLLLRGHF